MLLKNYINLKSLRITLIYILFGVFWITLSDSILEVVIQDPQILSVMHTIKGWFFVVITGLLIYYLIASEFDKQNRFEKDLKESEERLKILSGLSFEGIFIHKDGVMLDVNESFIKMTGFERDELIGKNVFDLFIPQEYKSAIALKTIQDNVDPYDLIGIRKDGTRIPVEIAARKINYRNNESRVASVRDITLRKKAESDLKAKEEQLRTLISNIPGVSYRALIDESWTMEFISQEIETLCGYKATDFIHNKVRTFASIIHPEDQEKARDQVMESIKAGQFFSIEYRIIASDNQIKWVFERGRGVIDGNDELKFIDGAIFDITDRKIAEQRLIESEQKFRSYFENAPNGIFIADLNGKFIDVNPYSCELTGYNHAELLNMGLKDIIHPDNMATAFKVIENIKVNGSGEYKFIKKDNSVYYMDINASKYEKDKLLGFCTDTTERRKLEKDLRTSQTHYNDFINNSTDLIGFWETPDGFKTNLPVEKQIDMLANSVVIEANKALWNTFNLTHQDEIVGKKYVELVSDYSEEVFRKFINSNYNLVNEVYYSKLKSGNELYGLENWFGTVEDGVLKYIWTTSKDITEQIKAEIALKEREEAYRSFFETARDAAFVTTIDGMFLNCNDGFAELLGYPNKSEVMNLNALDLYVNPDERQVLINNIVDKGFIKHFSFHLRKKNGDVIYVLSTVAALKEENGKIIGLQGTLTDDTERKRAEQALKKSELYFRTIFEKANDAIALIKYGKFVDCNSMMQKQYQLSKEDIVGFSPINFSPEYQPDGRLSVEKAAELIDNAEKGYSQIFEWIHKKSDGTLYDAEISLNKIDLGEGNSVILAFQRDITFRKYAERKLRDSEQRFRSIFDTAPIGIALVDMLGHPIVTNNALQSMIGYNSEELANMTFTEITHPEDSDADMKLFKELLEGKSESYNIEKRYIHRSGNIIWGNLFVTIIRDDEGNPINIIGLVEDITERKYAEEELNNYQNNLEKLVEDRTDELKKVNKKLEEEIRKQHEAELRVIAALEKEKELNKLKSGFISMASHEFRTPLTTILASTELLEMAGRKWPVEKYFRHIGKVKRAVTNMTSLLDDVLIMSKAESGMISLERKKADVNQFLGELIYEIKANPKFDHVLNVTVDNSIDRLDVDFKLLRQILENLLTNSVKYTPADTEINLSVNLDKTSAIFVVQDNGPGISKQDLNKIFEPFFRINTGSKIPGSGLGLSIVKRAVELHNGVIEIESAENKGTKFTIRIPLK